MKPTICEIARACKVSRGTVDRVVHGRPHVAPAVRDRIEKALRDHGYTSAKAAKKRIGSPALTIAVLLPKWTDHYFAQQIYAGINQAEHSINDPWLHVITHELASRSLEEYVAVLDELAATGVDGIILNAAQSPIIEMKIDELAERGISVVTYDADVPHSKRVCFIGQNIYQSGQIAAGLMVRFMRPHEKVLIITGRMDFESSKGRVDGFVRYLQSQGFPSDCYTIAECHERFDLASETVCVALCKSANLRHIYMANESIAGCVDGVRRAQQSGRVRIICNDLTPSAKKYLQNGQIDFVIGQTFTQKAYKAILTLHTLLQRHVPPKKERFYTDSFIISRELL